MGVQFSSSTIHRIEGVPRLGGRGIRKWRLRYSREVCRSCLVNIVVRSLRDSTFIETSKVNNYKSNTKLLRTQATLPQQSPAVLISYQRRLGSAMVECGCQRATARVSGYKSKLSQRTSNTHGHSTSAGYFIHAPRASAAARPSTPPTLHARWTPRPSPLRSQRPPQVPRRQSRQPRQAPTRSRRT